MRYPVEIKVRKLEERTEQLFGRPVAIEELGAVLQDATNLWLRQEKQEDCMVVHPRDFIPDFPPKLRTRLMDIIDTLEQAFDGHRDDEQELIKTRRVRIDGWLDL